MHYYQFNIADYRKDTTHLSRLEHSIYRDLIDWYYLDEAPIPLETHSVMRRLRLVSEDEATALKNVLSDFFVRSDGWRHLRIDQDIVEYHAMQAKNRANGKLGGRPKKTQSVSSGLPVETQNEPPVKATNNQEPYISTTDVVDNAGAKRPRFDAAKHLQSLGIDEQLAADWLAVRKAKKAAPTKTAIDGVASEATKAGIQLAEALRICCRQGWAGFRASWDWEPAKASTTRAPVNGRQAAISSYAQQAAAARGDVVPLVAIEGESSRVA